MKTARIICHMFGALLMLAGVFLLFWTEDCMKSIGAMVPAGFAMSNMRAVFGGLELGLGFLVIYLARSNGDVRTAALLVCTIFGGLILGRVFEIAVNGFPDESFFLTMLILEGFGVVGGFQALRDAKRTNPDR